MTLFEALDLHYRTGQHIRPTTDIGHPPRPWLTVKMDGPLSKFVTAEDEIAYTLAPAEVNMTWEAAPARRLVTVAELEAAWEATQSRFGGMGRDAFKRFTQHLRMA